MFNDEILFGIGKSIRDEQRNFNSLVKRVSKLEHYLLVLEDNPKIYLNVYEQCISDFIGKDKTEEVYNLIYDYIKAKLRECYKEINDLSDRLKNSVKEGYLDKL